MNNLEIYDKLLDDIVEEFAIKHNIKFINWLDKKHTYIVIFDKYEFDVEEILIDLRFNRTAGDILKWHNDNNANVDKRITYLSHIMGINRESDIDTQFINQAKNS